MENHQVIFVLRDNKISHWKYDGTGGLSLCTRKGMAEFPYNNEKYWVDWAEEKYFEKEVDVIDALFLTDSLDHFKGFPAWLSRQDKQSNWSLEIFNKLVKEEIFSNLNLSIVICGEECVFGKHLPDNATCKLFLRPSLSFKVPQLHMFLFKEHFYITGQDPSITKSYSFFRNVKFQRSRLQGLIESTKYDFVEGLNLPSENSLLFHLHENEDPILNSMAKKALGKQLSSSTPIDSMLISMIRRLSEDSSLKIGKYGVNFDGQNYLLSGGNLQKNPFSLLGYTIKDTEVAH